MSLRYQIKVTQINLILLLKSACLSFTIIYCLIVNLSEKKVRSIIDSILSIPLESSDENTNNEDDIPLPNLEDIEVADIQVTNPHRR